jgi:hypothetical protein
MWCFRFVLTVTLEIVLCANFLALHHLKNPVATNMGQAIVCAAVEVEKAPARQVTFDMETMVNPSIHNTWAAL